METILKNITVIHFPAQPHFFSYGGFDYQMNRVIEKTNSSFIISKKVDLWSRNEAFEIAHFWGAHDSNGLNIRFCQQNGIKVIISGLFPQKSLKTKLRLNLSMFIKGILNRKPVFLEADFIAVINKEQGMVVEKYYGYPSSKIRVIPTILDDYLYSENVVLNTEVDNKTVLCVGTICSRKNQIALAQSCLELGVNSIFVGKLETREPLYIKNFMAKVDNSNGLIKHYQDLRIEALSKLYKKCSLIACISHSETEPASILEAMIYHKPVVTSNLPFGKISKFSGVILCDPNSKKSIKRAIEVALSKNGICEYSNFNRSENQSEYVVELYTKMYRDALK